MSKRKKRATTTIAAQPAPPVPDLIDPADLHALQLNQERLRRLDAEIRMKQGEARQAAAVVNRIVDKYRLASGDGFAGLEIVRAAELAAGAAQAANGVPAATTPPAPSA